MIILEIPEHDREAITEELDDPEIDPRIRRKLMAIRMHALGVPHGKIAATLNISDDTVTNYVKLYRDEGLGGVVENRHYKPTSSVEPFLGQIEASFAGTPVATAGEGAQRIESICGIRLSDSQARRIMVRLGMRFRKCAAVPGKADPQMQFAFLEEELLPRLEEARRGERRVFFVDAAHFVLGAFLGMIWSFTRIFVRSGCGRQRYNVLGAVETRDHDLVSIRTTGSVNADTVCELVRKLARTYPGETITLVMDNARYQRNPKVFDVAERCGIELLFLPSYSPNLNLIERVWRLVKAKCLRNRYFEDFAGFMTAIDEFVDSLSGENRIHLQSLLTESFQIIEIPKC
jgi:transposase